MAEPRDGRLQIRRTDIFRSSRSPLSVAASFHRCPPSSASSRTISARTSMSNSPPRAADCSPRASAPACGLRSVPPAVRRSNSCLFPFFLLFLSNLFGTPQSLGFRVTGSAWRPCTYAGSQPLQLMFCEILNRCQSESFYR